MSKAAATPSSRAARSSAIDRRAGGRLPVSSEAAVVVGEVCRIDRDGTFFVDYPRNFLGPMEGRTVVPDLYLGASVLIVFEFGDPTLPIVVGLVANRIRTGGSAVHLKANTVVIEANEHLVLQCGEGRIEATREGELRLKGRDIVSRASRANKVQGSTVRLN
jgi:hypothetical protein